MHTCEEVYGGHECWHKGWWARATHEHTVAVSVGREHALAPACIRVLSKSYPSSEIWIFRLVEHTEQNVTLRYARWEGVASECKPQYRPAASTRRVLLIWTTYLRSVFLLAFPPCRRIVNVAHPPFTRSYCSPCIEQFQLIIWTIVVAGVEVFQRVSSFSSKRKLRMKFIILFRRNEKS